MDNNLSIFYIRGLHIPIDFVVTGHCASEILKVRIVGELYAQVSSFPTTGPETGTIAIITTTI